MDIQKKQNQWRDVGEAQRTGVRGVIELSWDAEAIVVEMDDDKVQNVLTELGH